MAPKKKEPKSTKVAAEGPVSALPSVGKKELYLQKEHAALTEHVNVCAQRARQFQWESEFLDKEAQQIRETSKVYLSYLTRRTVRRQNAIVSLNDQNRVDLARIKQQKAELVAQYTEREKAVRHQLLERETKLRLISKEAEAMQAWRELQLEQLTRIRVPLASAPHACCQHRRSFPEGPAPVPGSRPSWGGGSLLSSPFLPGHCSQGAIVAFAGCLQLLLLLA
uniref:DUF4515 domain-containing protein n=1 Tax=Varanus komodoensis TaxID=61221 RepID=A0A8D2LCW0_VARKO